MSLGTTTVTLLTAAFLTVGLTPATAAEAAPTLPRSGAPTHLLAGAGVLLLAAGAMVRRRVF